MVIFKSLLGLLIGAAIGFIGSIVVFIAVAVVVGLAKWDSKAGEHAGEVVAQVFWFASAFIGFVFPLVREARENHENFIGGLPWIASSIFAATTIGIIIYLVKYYPMVMSVEGTFSGVVLGALAGAGIGAIVPQISKRYRAKSETGPLSYRDCLSDALRLRVRYLGVPGITEDKNEKRQEPWGRPAVAVALLYILLVVGVGLTYSKNQSIPRPPTTEKPPGTKPAERPALGNEAAVSPIPGTSTIAPSITGRDPRASTGFIAFVSQRGRRREIFCMKPDGSCLRSLTNRLSSAFAFTWSPDGTKLLFRGGGVGDIYVVDRDGSNLRKILDLGEIVPDFPGVQSFQLDVQGTWLPDSRTIAVCAGSWPSSSNVYLIEVASLTRTTLCLAKAAWNPVWSPDGTRIAFKTFSSAGQQIRLADAKGARQVPVCAECDLQAGPLWLPDGKRFIFIKRGAWSQGKRNNKLCTKNVHDGEFTEADFSWDVTRGMAASPDGRKFAFSPEGDSRIHILHLAGNVWQPEATIENAGYPTWSPDGTSVAFVSSEDDQICLANVDGTGRVRIAPTPKDAASVGSKSSDGSDASAGDKQSPKWSPPQAPSDN